METLIAMMRHKHELQLPKGGDDLSTGNSNHRKIWCNPSAVFVKHKNLGSHVLFLFFDAWLLHHLYYPSWRDACIIQVLNAFSDGSKSVILSEIFIPFRFLSGFFFLLFCFGLTVVLRSKALLTMRKLVSLKSTRGERGWRFRLKKRERARSEWRLATLWSCPCHKV